jgi:hypothetical protein
MHHLLTFGYEFLEAPDDADARLAMKAERTAIALTPAKRIVAVLGEQVLHTRRGTPSEHSQQLQHLLEVMRLPFVSVGIIPADAQRFATATVGFWIFDQNAVALETPTAAIKVTRPQEIARYAAMFERLRAKAVYGEGARRLINSVIDRGTSTLRREGLAAELHR